MVKSCYCLALAELRREQLGDRRKVGACGPEEDGVQWPLVAHLA